MRRRIIFLVIATSSLVLVSFLLPLAIVLRAQAADRAVSAATIQAQGMTPLVATLRTSSLRLAVDQVNAENGSTPITVFLPGRRELGVTAPRSAACVRNTIASGSRNETRTSELVAITRKMMRSLMRGRGA